MDGGGGGLAASENGFFDMCLYIIFFFLSFFISVLGKISLEKTIFQKDFFRNWLFSIPFFSLVPWKMESHHDTGADEKECSLFLQ